MKRTSQKAEKINQVYEFIKSNPNTSTPDLIEKFKYSKPCVKDYLIQLRMEKKIYVSGKAITKGGEMMLFSAGNKPDIEYRQLQRNAKHLKNRYQLIEKILQLCEFEAKSIKDVADITRNSYAKIDHLMRKLNLSKMIYVARYEKTKKFFKTGSKDDAPSPVFNAKEYRKKYNREAYLKRKALKEIDVERAEFVVVKKQHLEAEKNSKPDLAASWLFNPVK